MVDEIKYMMMKNIIDYYYESTQTITIRIICDNCKICKDNNNEYWSIGNSPKTYISYDNKKFTPISVQSETRYITNKMTKICDCKLYDDFSLYIPYKEKFDPSKLSLMMVGDGISLELIEYDGIVKMSRGYSDGFY